MRILIVDDDEISREMLRAALVRAGHEVLVAEAAATALQLVLESRFTLVISDWEMPGMTGPELCQAIRAADLPHYVYIILLTARNRVQDVVAGLSAGADDFLSKPFDPAELAARVRSGERVLALETRDVTIFAMAKLAESRDPETGAHLDRIRRYCRVLGQQLLLQQSFAAELNSEFVRLLYLTSPLHDIGKVGIPDSVLLKPGRLTDEEFAIMKAHTTIGAETLEAAMRQYPEVQFLKMARDIALTHHERFDGKGYPHGRSGHDIPLCGRIVAVADVYDALTSKRVYKEAFTHAVTREMIFKEAGTHFDPAIVAAFATVEPRFQQIQRELMDEVAPAHAEAVGAVTVGA